MNSFNNIAIQDISCIFYVLSKCITNARDFMLNLKIEWPKNEWVIKKTLERITHKIFNLKIVHKKIKFLIAKRFRIVLLKFWVKQTCFFCFRITLKTSWFSGEKRVSGFVSYWPSIRTSKGYFNFVQNILKSSTDFWIFLFQNYTKNIMVFE